MLKLLIMLQFAAHKQFSRVRPQNDQRGSVTMEHAFWAGAVIVIVTIVFAAIKSYVTTQAGKIN